MAFNRSITSACRLSGTVVLLLLALASVALARQSTTAQAQAAQPPQNEPAQAFHYVIGPLDVLVITLWDQAETPGKFTVEADGSFTFPYIGRIQAAGLSLRQFEGELKKRLTDGGFFKNPQVSVAVEQYRSQQIFVVGEVRTPGAYILTGEMTLIEALARAGSTTISAADEAVIVRPKSGTQRTGPVLPDNQAVPSEIIKVDIKELQGGALGHNVALRDGDTLFVPRAESIYVFGQVKAPGAYPLQGKNRTVLQALSLAGGVTDRGSTNRIQIIRIVNGEKQEIKVKLTDTVKPGDTIIVKERFF
jgi:polysaccharide export outer membrane protein